MGNIVNRNVRRFAETYLKPQEIIGGWAIGYIGEFGKRDHHTGVLIATDNRVVFFKNSSFDELLAEIPLKDVEWMNISHLLDRRVLTIKTATSYMEFKSFDERVDTDIVPYLNECRTSLNKRVGERFSEEIGEYSVNDHIASEFFHQHNSTKSVPTTFQDLSVAELNCSDLHGPKTESVSVKDIEKIYRQEPVRQKWGFISVIILVLLTSGWQLYRYIVKSSTTITFSQDTNKSTSFAVWERMAESDLTEDFGIPPYKILSENKFFGKSRRVLLLLEKRVSDETIEDLAHHIKSLDQKKYQKIYIDYYLSGMSIDSDPWLSVSFSPDFRLQMFGLSLKDYNKLMQLPVETFSGEVVGQWLEDRAKEKYKLVVYRKDGGYFGHRVFLNGRQDTLQYKVDKVGVSLRLYEGNSLKKDWLELSKDKEIQRWTAYRYDHTLVKLSFELAD